MNWITVIWSMVAGASLAMALPHVLIAVKQRGAWINLLFAIAALAVAGTAVAEMAMMHAQTTKQLAEALQWVHVPVFVLVVAIFGFVRLYFGTGRMWLGGAACVLRLVTLVINFAQPPNLNFQEITSLRRFELLGEIIALPEGVAGPWTRLAQLSSLLLLAFVVDASVALWRRGRPGDRRRALVVGGGITVFILLAAGVSALILETTVKAPYFVSFSFLAIIVAMSFELSRDLLRSAQLAGQLQASEGALRESERRMELAASAAELGLWVWEIESDAIWATDKTRALLGFGRDEPLDFGCFMRGLHPEDHELVRAAVEKSFENAGDYRTEYRILQDSSPPRWISARGRVEFDATGRPVRMRGVSIDVTERKQAETELRQNREELAHVGRVALMGELAASLAHELNQPLTGIVTNAQVGQRLLEQRKWDAAEFREILQDIADDGKRAGEVIRSVRNMVKKGGLPWELLDLNDVVTKATRLIKPDGLARGCEIRVDLEPNLPKIRGVRIQLKQVLLNLIANAFDATEDPDPDRRIVILSTACDGAVGVRLTVRDFGVGLPAESEKVFEQFFSTKREGLGMGLVIARSIIEAHGGRLVAENVEGGGACFHFTLPANSSPRT
ncbi:MAG: ATP-binding protein [Terrimicrobiaceae bacterium]